MPDSRNIPKDPKDTPKPKDVTTYEKEGKDNPKPSSGPGSGKGKGR